MPDLLVWPALVLLGVAVGSYGTIVGAGGGFVLVPLLLLVYPDDPPEQITSVSLAVVFFNSASGTAAHMVQKRIDFLAANAFAVATIPGALIGAFLTSYVPRRTFDLIFAFLLLAVSALIIFRPSARVAPRTGRRGEVVRQITDASYDTYVYSYDLRTGVLFSLFIGFIASLFGIGGGLVQVPVLVYVLHFPAHIATATSQYVLIVTSLAAGLVHLFAGEYSENLGRTAALAIGVVMGGQIGARLSLRMRGALIVRLLAAALIVVAVRLLVADLL